MELLTQVKNEFVDSNNQGITTRAKHVSAHLEVLARLAEELDDKPNLIRILRLRQKYFAILRKPEIRARELSLSDETLPGTPNDYIEDEYKRLINA